MMLAAIRPELFGPIIVANKVAGKPRFERNADFAIGLEPTDPGAVPSARIDNHERTPLRVDFDACRWIPSRADTGPNNRGYRPC
jgi:hypothetical protein